MSLLPKKIEFSDINQTGQNNSQIIAETVNITYDSNILTNPLNQSRKSCIIQEVLEGIINLDIIVEATELDVEPFSIPQKIDHNKIVVYKNAYKIYMEDKILIEHRLKILQNNSNPLAAKKLINFIKQIYAKHCNQIDPDTRIHCMCEEIKNDLLNKSNISDDDIAYIPAIIFYIFSLCHIFDKPPAS